MISNAISIGNKLEVRDGNVIYVPGCEPLTSFTSVTLGANIDCNASTIPLRDAIAAIPGATIEATVNPRRLFLVLPSGPPPKPGCKQTSPCSSIVDHYQTLRDATPEPQKLTPITSTAKECDEFPFSGCL